MKLAIFLAISFLLTNLNVSLCLTLKCDFCDYSCDYPDSETCYIYNVEVPLKRDRLEFEYETGNANTILYLSLRSEEGKGFTSIPSEVFQIFSNLNTFHLTRSVEVITPNDFQNATNLKHFTVSYIRVKELDANAFNGLDNLEGLAVVYSSLRIIRRNAIAGLINLSDIDLTHNRINTIEDGAFDLPNLRKIKLGFNDLTTLSDLTFCKLPKLEDLNLFYNKLKHIGRSLYCSSNITRILLSENSINDIDLYEFAKLPHLDSLDLEASGFAFDSNAKESIVENTSLKTLNLRKNNLTNELDLKQLSIFKGLDLLFLDGNPYTSFDLGDKDITTILPSLTQLSLGQTQISSDKTDELKSQLDSKNVTLYLARLW